MLRQIELIQDPEFQDMKPYFDFTDLHDYAKDFGGIVSHKPYAVFMPPTVEILQRFLILSSRYQIKITCRGKGNSVYGQSQVQDGVVIDLKNLDVSMEFISDDVISVPAFKTWSDVTELTLQRNLTVPVLPDNLDLTIGGTLSFGALGGTSYRCGSGADNVVSLDVVTLDGRRQTCSNTENSELFNAVLCGQGQFGIMIKANLPLIDAKKFVNLHRLTYSDLGHFLRDQKSLYESGVFDHLKGHAKKTEGRWKYVIEASTYYDEHVNDSIEKTLLALTPVDHVMQTLPYREFINLVTNFVSSVREAGKLNVPLPWYNVLVPEDEIKQHLQTVLDTPHFAVSEPIIVYPMKSEFFQKPFFIKPDTKTFYCLAALYNMSLEANSDFPFSEILERNYRLYREGKENNICRYPFDAIPFTYKDWVHHYGQHWQTFCSLKKKYDPQYLLSTGGNFGFMKNTVTIQGEIVAPIDVSWNASDE